MRTTKIMQQGGKLRLRLNHQHPKNKVKQAQVQSKEAVRNLSENWSSLTPEQRAIAIRDVIVLLADALSMEDAA